MHKFCLCFEKEGDRFIYKIKLELTFSKTANLASTFLSFSLCVCVCSSYVHISLACSSFYSTQHTNAFYTFDNYFLSFKVRLYSVPFTYLCTCIFMLCLRKAARRVQAARPLVQFYIVYTVYDSTWTELHTEQNRRRKKKQQRWWRR